MSALDRISNAPLFRALDASEASMILGGQETVHTFVRNSDGSLTYIGKDMVIEPAQPAQPVDQA